jgi:two-component system response regulator AlgR
MRQTTGSWISLHPALADAHVMTMRVVIVDDEPVAIRRLSRLLSTLDVEVVGSAGTAEQALSVVARTTPDLVLLDIEMPGANGIDLAAKCRALPNPPAIVFVTAFSRFAIAAFDLAADHYLLKPVEVDQLDNALRRVAQKLLDRQSASRTKELEDVVAQLRASDDANAQEQYLWLPDPRGHARIRLSDIIWISAERDYVRIHLRGKSYLARGRIHMIASRLASHGFIRVHRSAIVRAGCIEHVGWVGDRRYRLTLSDGTRVEVSRRFAAEVRLLHQPVAED